MDLSTGGDIDGIRAAIIANSPVPIGTVPIYQVLKERKNVEDIRADDLIDMLEHQAKQGSTTSRSTPACSPSTCRSCSTASRASSRAAGRSWRSG
jgi:thiamine biosynthesis protein ThiC